MTRGGKPNGEKFGLKIPARFCVKNGKFVTTVCRLSFQQTVMIFGCVVYECETCRSRY